MRAAKSSKDKRLFARLDLDYADHPKIGALSDAAFRAHVELILYTRKYLTDGVVPGHIARRRYGPVLDELQSNDPVSPSLVANSDGSFTLHGYADMNETRAEVEARQARNSENGKLGGRPPKTQSETESETQSVAESESESGTQTKAETETEAETSSGRAKRATRLPDSWTPNDSHRRIALERNLDLAHEANQFRAHAKANGRTQKDWDASFTLWLGNARPRLVTVDPFSKPAAAVPAATPSPGSAADQGMCRHWLPQGACSKCEEAAA